MPHTEVAPWIGEITAMDCIGDTMMDRPLARVRQRLIAQLGNAVADSFQVAPSDRAGNQLVTVALLLPRHLPILVPVHDDPEDRCFLVAQYDIAGRRLHDSPGGDQAVRYQSLANAILASGRAFDQLKEWFEERQTEGWLDIDRPTHRLPEEKWLHRQLVCCRSSLPAFAAIHQGGGSSSNIC